MFNILNSKKDFNFVIQNIIHSISCLLNKHTVVFQMCRTCLIFGLFLLFILSPARPLAASSVFSCPVGVCVIRHVWLWVSGSVVVVAFPSLCFPLMSLMLRPAQFISLVQWVFLVKVIYGVVGGEGRTLRASAGIPVPAPLVPGPHTWADPVPGFKVGFPALGQPSIVSFFLIIPPVVSLVGVLVATGMGRPVPRGPAGPHAVAPVRPAGRPRWTVGGATGGEARTVWARTQRTTDWTAWSVTLRQVPAQNSSRFERMIKKNLKHVTKFLEMCALSGLLFWKAFTPFSRKVQL